MNITTDTIYYKNLFNDAKDASGDDPAPPYCEEGVDLTAPFNLTAWDNGNPKCTPIKFDTSWTKYFSKSCDTWMLNVTPEVNASFYKYIRVNALLFNDSCGVDTTRLSTFQMRKQARCREPYRYVPTKYIQITFYKKDPDDPKTPNKHTYKFQFFCKASGIENTSSPTLNGGTSSQTQLQVCAPDGSRITYAIVGRVSEGWPSLVPASWVQNASISPKADVYMLVMRDGGPLGLFVHDESTPETVAVRLPRLDYVDTTIDYRDPPIHKTLDSVFWVRTVGVAGFVLFSILMLQLVRYQQKKKT